MNCQEFTTLIIKETCQYNTYWACTVILSTVLESEYLKMSNSPCPIEAHNIEIVLSDSSWV